MSNKKDYSWGAPVMSYGAPPMDRSVRVEPFEVVPWPPETRDFRDIIKEVQGKCRAALRPPPPRVEQLKPMRLKKPYHVRKRVLFECGCETGLSKYIRGRMQEGGYVHTDGQSWKPFYSGERHQVMRLAKMHGYNQQDGSPVPVYRKQRLLATAWFVNVKGVARQLTEFVPVDGPMECKTCGHDVEEAKR